MSTKQKFGVGALIATARFDATGAALAVPTPFRIGILQDISADFSFERKTIYGERQLAIASGRGKGKLAFSAKTADINVAALAALHFGINPTPGFRGPVMDEPHVITNHAAGCIVPNGGGWEDDLGVMDTSGNNFSRVAAAPGSGQYSVLAGAYTFNAGDEGKAILISYEYASSTGGIIVPLSNLMMGDSPSFSVVLYNGSKGSKLALKLNHCESDKLSLPFKNEDFVIADFGWEALDDGTGSAGYWCQST